MTTRHGPDEAQQAAEDAAEERLAATMKRTAYYYEIFADIGENVDITLGDKRPKADVRAENVNEV